MPATRVWPVKAGLYVELGRFVSTGGILLIVVPEVGGVVPVGGDTGVSVSSDLQEARASKLLAVRISS